MPNHPTPIRLTKLINLLETKLEHHGDEIRVCISEEEDDQLSLVTDDGEVVDSVAVCN